MKDQEEKLKKSEKKEREIYRNTIQMSILLFFHYKLTVLLKEFKLTSLN